jgi:hypothetical protein
VSGSFDPKRNAALIDLGTLREALAHIRDELQRVQGLERVAELLAAAVAEADAAGRRRLAPIPRSVLDARRLARRRH